MYVLERNLLKVIPALTLDHIVDCILCNVPSSIVSVMHGLVIVNVNTGIDAYISGVNAGATTRRCRRQTSPPTDATESPIRIESVSS